MQTELILSASFENSSNISKIEYDSAMKILTIMFINGGTYDFVDVGNKIFTEMKEAQSAGKFFHNNIRGKFDFLKKTR